MVGPGWLGDRKGIQSVNCAESYYFGTSRGRKAMGNWVIEIHLENFRLNVYVHIYVIQTRMIQTFRVRCVGQ